MHLFKNRFHVFLAFLLTVFLSVECLSAGNPMDEAETLGVYEVVNMNKFPVYAIWDCKMKFPLNLFVNSEMPSRKVVTKLDDPLQGAVNVFLFSEKTKDDEVIVMVDAGYVPLVARLDNLSIKPDDVDYIMLTHVHPDHIGGLLDAKGKAIFSKAKIYLSKSESEAQKPPKSKMHSAWQRVLAAYPDRVVVFEDGEQTLPGGLSAIAAPGHTPGHTVYLKKLQKIEKMAYFDDKNEVKEKEVVYMQKLYFIGDLIHGAELQFAEPNISCKFDGKYSQAAATRKRILSEVAKGTTVQLPLGNTMVKSVIFSAHAPFPGAGAILNTKHGFSFVGEEK